MYIHPSISHVCAPTAVCRWKGGVYRRLSNSFSIDYGVACLVKLDVVWTALQSCLEELSRPFLLPEALFHYGIRLPNHEYEFRPTGPGEEQHSRVMVCSVVPELWCAVWFQSCGV